MKPRRITNTPYAIAMVIVLFIVVPLGIAVTFYDYRVSVDQMNRLEAEIITNLTADIRLELDNALSLKEFYSARSEERFKKKVRSEAARLRCIVENVFWKEKKTDRKTREALLKSIIRPMRFGGGQGFYFGLSTRGTAHILPMNPELEGQDISSITNTGGQMVFRDMITIALESNGGFHEFQWNGEQSGNADSNMLAYVMKMPGMDWIIGAAEFTGDMEKETREILIELVGSNRFHQSDFILMLDRSGTLLSENYPYPEDRYKHDLVKRLVNLRNQECFTFTGGEKETGDRTSMVCANYFPTWDWIIAFGVNMKSINQSISEKRARQMRQSVAHLVIIGGFLIVIAVIVVIISRHFKKDIERGFSAFADFFTQASQHYSPMDINAINIIEFRELAGYANTMVRDRIRQEAVIEKTTRELKNVNTRLEQMASVDGLTNVYNRRYFDAALEKELARCSRHREPLALGIMDIDFFKAYNDRYGHKQGDDCLKRFASALASVVRRPSDVFARYGGEEFVVILPGTDSQGLVSVAEKMKHAVAELNMVHEGSQISGRVTFSMGGLSVVPGQEDTADALIVRADAALYLAKSEGRNCFRLEAHEPGRHHPMSQT